MIEGQERHKKSPPPKKTPQARCSSSGGLLICIFLNTSLKNVIFIKILNGAKVPNHKLGHFMFCYNIKKECMGAWISDCRKIDMSVTPVKIYPMGCADPVPPNYKLYATICEKPL